MLKKEGKIFDTRKKLEVYDFLKEEFPNIKLYIPPVNYLFVENIDIFPLSESLTPKLFTVMKMDIGLIMIVIVMALIILTKNGTKVILIFSYRRLFNNGCV